MNQSLTQAKVLSAGASRTKSDGHHRCSVLRGLPALLEELAAEDAQAGRLVHLVEAAALAPAQQRLIAKLGALHADGLQEGRAAQLRELALAPAHHAQ